MSTNPNPVRGEERIVAAAIKSGDMTFSIAAPARHGDIIRSLHGLGLKHQCHGDQGFLTSGGKFVTRWQAMRIATLAEQLKPRTSAYGDELYSEDVW